MCADYAYVWSAAPVAFWGWGRRWNSGNTRAAPLVIYTIRFRYG